MSKHDYGQFIQRMRKSRGLTQDQLADAAGVSTSTVTKLEASGAELNIRATNLDALLTALAQRAPLGASEIQVLAEATDRRYESFEAINTRAAQLAKAAQLGPSPRVQGEPTIEERIERAIHLLLAAGQGETVAVQLEALAAHYGHLISEQEHGKGDKPGEGASS